MGTTISGNRARVSSDRQLPAIASDLIEKLKKLPPQRLAEVEDFVEFLAAREERAAAAQRLSEAFAKLDALKPPGGAT